MKSGRFSVLALMFFAAAVISGCNSSNDGAGGGNPQNVLPDTSSADPRNPGTTTAPSTPSSGDRSYSTDILLFNGIGISTSDWQTTEQIVQSEKFSYRLVNSAQLNAMSLDEMASFGLMIFPGGYGNQITDGLTAATRIKVRQAVRERGVSFLGICAGAWVAVGPDPGANAASYGFAIVPGNGLLDVYLPGGVEPVAAMVSVSFADGANRSLVWWGGPITPSWINGVVARYETGDPAISQTWAGKGFVVVSGPHPEAPQGWRTTAGYDSDGLDFDIAANLMHAALERKPLKTF